MSLEMAHKVILPPKKNYIPQFLKQRDINSYYYRRAPVAYWRREGPCCVLEKGGPLLRTGEGRAPVVQ
jgi:hypothetical protein